MAQGYLVLANSIFNRQDLELLLPLGLFLGFEFHEVALLRQSDLLPLLLGLLLQLVDLLQLLLLLDSFQLVLVDASLLDDTVLNLGSFLHVVELSLLVVDLQLFSFRKLAEDVFEDLVFDLALVDQQLD